jgi:hypothetical protein
MLRALAAVRRTPAAVAALVLAACAGTGDPPVAARGLQRVPADAAATRTQPATAEPTAPFAPATALHPGAGTAATAGDEVDERELRRELATAADPSGAALDLAQALVGAERVDEALAAVDAALARVRNDTLRVARAGLLRDLGQRHAAVAELRSLRRDVGPGALHPAALFELAELEWLEGEPEACQATLQQLQTEHARHSWFTANAVRREQLAAAVARGGPPRHIGLRDLFGNLRGAPLATERLAVLDQVQRSAVSAEAKSRAIAIAIADESPAVRARAVQLAAPPPAAAAAFCEGALADGAVLVRRAAIVRTVELLGAGARPVLLRALAAEPDAAVFVGMHEALARLAGVTEPLDPRAVADASARAEVVARWRARSTP